MNQDFSDQWKEWRKRLEKQMLDQSSTMRTVEETTTWRLAVMDKLDQLETRIERLLAHRDKMKA